MEQPGDPPREGGQLSLPFFFIISAGPCSKMEWDWITSGRPRPRPCPSRCRSRSRSFFSFLTETSSLGLGSGEVTRHPHPSSGFPSRGTFCPPRPHCAGTSRQNRLRTPQKCLRGHLLFLDLPANYVGGEGFLQTRAEGQVTARAEISNRNQTGRGAGGGGWGPGHVLHGPAPRNRSWGCGGSPKPPQAVG